MKVRKSEKVRYQNGEICGTCFGSEGLNERGRRKEDERILVRRVCSLVRMTILKIIFDDKSYGENSTIEHFHTGEWPNEQQIKQGRGRDNWNMATIELSASFICSTESSHAVIAIHFLSNLKTKIEFQGEKEKRKNRSDFAKKFLIFQLLTLSSLESTFES